MKIISLHAGFGNQIFHYIFFRYIQEHNPNEFCVMNNPNSFDGSCVDMERAFGIRPPLFMDYFAQDTWNEVLSLTSLGGKVARQRLMEKLGLCNFSFVDDSINFEEQNNYTVKNDPLKVKYRVANGSFNEEIAHIPGDVYYFGYWHNVHYFQYLMPKILDELTFTPIDDDFNKRIADMIMESNSIGVHIRTYFKTKWDISPGYWIDAISKMRQYVSNPVWFVFSDAISEISDKLAQYGFLPKDKIVFVDGNTGEKSFRDMHLMSLCKHLIMANSSFSMSAALLNRNPNKLIIRPSRELEII